MCQSSRRSSTAHHATKAGPSSVAMNASWSRWSASMGSASACTRQRVTSDGDASRWHGNSAPLWNDGMHPRHRSTSDALASVRHHLSHARVTRTLCNQTSLLTSLGLACECNHGYGGCQRLVGNAARNEKPRQHRSERWRRQWAGAWTAQRVDGISPRSRTHRWLRRPTRCHRRAPLPLLARVVSGRTCGHRGPGHSP